MDGFMILMQDFENCQNGQLIIYNLQTENQLYEQESKENITSCICGWYFHTLTHKIIAKITKIQNSCIFYEHKEYNSGITLVIQISSPVNCCSMNALPISINKGSVASRRYVQHHLTSLLTENLKEDVEYGSWIHRSIKEIHEVHQHNSAVLNPR